jgi:hypothetical protein
MVALAPVTPAWAHSLPLATQKQQAALENSELGGDGGGFHRSNDWRGEVGSADSA